MIRIQQQRGRGAGPRHASLARIFLMAPVMAAVLSAGAALAQPVSPAEVLLFETDHLARTKAPAALVYDFRKVSNIEAGFTDTVELDLTKEDGHMHARLRFLSGERKRELPDIDDAHGNPVLLGFLEHDIAEMKRLTGGSSTYFRKRIRMALANAAQLSKQTINFQGKSYEGQAVRIQPYLDDPLHARFEAYVHKTYTFILSDAVPGGVYQLSTSLGTSGSGRTINATADARAGVHAEANAGALADARVAKRPPAAAGAAASGAATSGATPSDDATPSGVAATGPASAGKADKAPRPGTGGPGSAPGSPPVLEETLTLVKVADPKR